MGSFQMCRQKKICACKTMHKPIENEISTDLLLRDVLPDMESLLTNIFLDLYSLIKKKKTTP